MRNTFTFADVVLNFYMIYDLYICTCDAFDSCKQQLARNRRQRLSRIFDWIKLGMTSDLVMTYSLECFRHVPFGFKDISLCFMRIHLSGYGGHVLLNPLSDISPPPNGRSERDGFVHVFFIFFGFSKVMHYFV